jgi:hypothetical protein
MKKLSIIWFHVQEFLFPYLEKHIEEKLSDKLKKLVSILEVVRIEDFIKNLSYNHGRYPENRRQIARAFIAKAVYNLSTTRDLIEKLKTTPALRRICGWEHVGAVPHESSFSRAFAESAQNGLAQLVHEKLVKEHLGDEEHILGNISRDSTSIYGREKPEKKAKETAKKKPKKKPGRPKKGEEPEKEPTRLERQKTMTPEEMIDDLPTACDKGTKKNSKGYKKTWNGYKLHIDAVEGHLPISCILTSASVHDSQAALPLAEMTNQRVTNLYDLMDAAYDSNVIKEHSRSLGHVPIIDINPRGNKELKVKIKEENKIAKLINFESAESRHYNERSNVERVNGRLKDEFGGRMVRVRGAAKVMLHLMFGILALTADQLLRLAA